MKLRELPIVVLRPEERPVAWPWAILYWSLWLGATVAVAALA